LHSLPPVQPPCTPNKTTQLLTAALLQPPCRAVHSLDLADNTLGPDAVVCLVPLLHEPPAAARRRLSTDALAPAAAAADRAFSSGGSASATAAAAAPGAGFRLSSGGFGGLTSQHALLTRLVLAGNPIRDAGAEVLFRLVGTGECPLELLDVSGCSIGDRSAAALQALLEGARQLQVMRLGWNSLGLRTARTLAEGLKLCSTLEQLHLAWSGVTDTGVAHIAKVGGG
jgi:Ran GTPase-activating protein (RanGAP) involved in mRNA processing and transport